MANENPGGNPNDPNGKVTGGNPSDPAPTPTPDPSNDPTPAKSDKVAYETYLKVLDEKKRFQARNTELEEKENARKAEADSAEKARLEKNGEFEALLKKEKEEKDALAIKLGEHEQRATDSKKLSAFLKSLNGDIAPQYWGLIDVDKIKVSDDGTVDEMSVTKLVEETRKSLPDIIKIPGQKSTMPDGAPNHVTPLSVEQWQALPIKEKRERLKDVHSAYAEGKIS